MPAELVPIARSSREIRGREKTLRQDFNDAWRSPTDQKFRNVASKYVDYLEHRITQLEHTVRRFLTTESLTAEQRTELLETLYGAGSPDSNPKLLNPAERRFLQNYRAVDTAGRQMMRGLCDRLAATSDAGGAS